MREKSVNQNYQKQVNSWLVKKQLYLNSPISRVEIAHNLGLTTPAVGTIVAPLIAQGLIREEVATMVSRRLGAGRPRLMMEFVPESYYICGVDLGPYYTNYILTDFMGSTVACRKVETPLEEYHRTLRRLASEIPSFLKESQVPADKIMGVGVVMPGLIDGHEGRIYTTFRQGWTDRDPAAELSAVLNLPVLIENNVRGKVIGAEMFDRMATKEPFAFFSVYYGIACQMIIGDKVLYGDNAAAGEIGHMVVQRGGPVCPTCGNRGCLEAVTGERAVVDRCRSAMAANRDCLLWNWCPTPEAVTMEWVLQAQEQGDPYVGEIVEDVLDYLGIALANTVNLVSPRMIVVDGRMFNLPQNRELLIRSAERNMFRVHSSRAKLTFLPYDPYRGAKGAAAVVVKSFLSNG